MKTKIKIIAIIIAIIIIPILVILLLIADLFASYVDQDKEANIILEDLITALDNNNSKSIKKMFAIEVQNTMGENLDKQIEELCEFYEGTCVKYNEIDDVSGGEEYKDYELVFSRISNAHCDNVETSESNYIISFASVLVDESNKDNEGIWRIWIGTDKNNYLIIGNSDVP